ncbi:MAG: zinc-finger domain-containing protein [Hyphomonadaceae bacterium]
MTKLRDNPRTDQATPGDPDAIPAPEVITVTSKRVKCDGGGGALGHPIVFYDMGEEPFVECGYCDRRFVLAVGAGGGGH